MGLSSCSNRKCLTTSTLTTPVGKKGLLEQLAREGQLMAYCHDSFWQCMDTLREKYILEELWVGGNAPWKTWR